jgi:hypothetical protein
MFDYSTPSRLDGSSKLSPPAFIFAIYAISPPFSSRTLAYAAASV